MDDVALCVGDSVDVLVGVKLMVTDGVIVEVHMGDREEVDVCVRVGDELGDSVFDAVGVDDGVGVDVADRVIEGVRVIVIDVDIVWVYD